MYDKRSMNPLSHSYMYSVIYAKPSWYYIPRMAFVAQEGETTLDLS